MEASTSMRALKDLFSYPLKSPGGQGRFVIGVGLVFAGYVIPILPLIPVLGYVAKIMRNISLGDGRLTMPEWEDWGTLFADGFRILGLGIMLLLPAFIVGMIGWGAYFGSFIGLMITGVMENERAMGPFVLVLPIAMLFMFFSQFISMLLSILSIFLLPVTYAHVATRRSLRSFFQLDWWRVLAANPGGFLMSTLLLIGLSALQYFVFLLLYMSIVLCMAYPFALAVLSFYTLLIGGVISAQAYREGMEKRAEVPAAPVQTLGTA